MRKPREKRETPLTILAAEHYRSIGLENGWTWQQVLNLCTLLKQTPTELFAFYGIPRQISRQYEKSGRVPTYIALHFLLRQQYFIEKTIGTPMSQILPDTPLHN